MGERFALSRNAYQSGFFFRGVSAFLFLQRWTMPDESLVLPMIETLDMSDGTVDVDEIMADEVPEEAREITYRAIDAEYRESSDGETSTFLISTPNDDRYQSVIESKGIDLKHFRKNPVVKFDHGWDFVRGELPVAKSIHTVRKEDGILATVKWWTDEFSQNVRDMVKAGFLNAASIGFIPVKWEWRENEDGKKTLVYKKVELLEFSIVSVPANRQSLVQQRGARPAWLHDITSEIEGLSQEIRAMRAVDLTAGESPVEATAEAVPGEPVAQSTEGVTVEPVPEQESATEQTGGRLIQMRMSDMLALQRETVQAARSAATQELNRRLGRA